MATQKQIEANQRNAQKSTGPITDVRSITTSVSSFLLHSRFARPARPLRVCAGQTPRHLLCQLLQTRQQQNRGLPKQSQFRGTPTSSRDCVHDAWNAENRLPGSPAPKRYHPWGLVFFLLFTGAPRGQLLRVLGDYPCRPSP